MPTVRGLDFQRRWSLASHEQMGVVGQVCQQMPLATALCLKAPDLPGSPKAACEGVTDAAATRRCAHDTDLRDGIELGGRLKAVYATISGKG